LVVPETAETEVPPVYEKVAMIDPMSELVDVGMPDLNPMIAVLIAAFEAVTFASLKAVTFASFEAVTIFSFVAVVQVSIAAFLIVDRSALRSLVSATELTARTTVKCRCPRGATRHHRWTATAKVSTTVNGCTTAKAWTAATTYMCRSASTTAAAHSSATSATSATTAAAVMALRVSAARKDKR
jgi:hypothetical protein